MKNLRAFKIRYMGATETLGSRIKIIDLRFNVSKTIDYDYSYNSSSEQIEHYLQGRGIVCLYTAESKNEILLLTNNFDAPIK